MLKKPFLDSRTIIILIIMGVLIRVFLMPFFCHVDLYSEFRRVYYSIENEIFFPQQNRLVTFYIEYAFLKLFLPFLKDPQMVFYLEDIGKSTSNLTDYFIFISHPGIFRHLFIFKLPYLIFDILTMLTIWAFFKNKECGRLALCLWIFNPIILYSIYMFGRYESIPIFFVAMTALLLQKEKPLWAALFLVAAINSREIYIVTVPFFLISLYRDREGFIENMSRILIPLSMLVAGVVAPIFFVGYFELMPSFSQETVYEDDRANMLFSLSQAWFYPLIFAYFLTLFAFTVQGFRSLDYKFIVGSGIAIASYFLLSNHSAHYVAWLPLFPILILAYAREPRKLAIAIVILFVFWFVYRIFQGDVNLFTLFLAGPFNFDMTLFPSLSRVYTRLIGDAGSIFEPVKVLNSLHTMFAASIVFLIVEMTKTKGNIQSLGK